MQGRSKPNSNPNNSYTSHSASTIYNNKVHQTLPLSLPPACNKSHIHEANTKYSPLPSSYQKTGEKRRDSKRKCVTLWGRLTASTSLNLPCDSHLHNKNNYLPTFLRLPKQSQQQRKRKEWRNVTIWQPAISGGGNSVFTGLASTFHTSTKRRFLSCQRAIIAVFFALFATGCTRYEYINLTDEDEESAPIDTTTRGNQGSSFDFDTCDSEPIDVDLNPQK